MMPSKTESDPEKPEQLPPVDSRTTNAGTGSESEGVGNFQSYYLKGWRLQVLNVG